MVLTGGKRVVALAGGVGGAKLAYGLAQVVPSQQLTIIGNVADDLELYGLHISPDLDTVMYTLAGRVNPETGWGLADESWHMREMLRAYGEDAWFGLGDRDLATHALRTEALRRGARLTEITARLARALGVEARLLPVTDNPYVTMVDTVEKGTLGFQEYFVRYGWQPTVERIWFRGKEQAHITDEVRAALDEADMIVVCPSNPVLSIEPILAVPGMREQIQSRSVPCVAVSPFIGGEVVKGPAKKLMGELGLDISPQGLAKYYAGVIDGLVVDVSDAEVSRTLALPVLVTPTLMTTSSDKRRLAEEIIQWVGRISR